MHTMRLSIGIPTIINIAQDLTCPVSAFCCASHDFFSHGAGLGFACAHSSCPECYIYIYIYTCLFFSQCFHWCPLFSFSFLNLISISSMIELSNLRYQMPPPHPSPICVTSASYNATPF